jgi:hypothetical protein
VGGVSDADAALHSEPSAVLHVASGSETLPQLPHVPQPQEIRPVVPPVAPAFTATPTRPTTFATCRQKRIRRRQATRDSTRHADSHCDPPSPPPTLPGPAAIRRIDRVHVGELAVALSAGTAAKVFLSLKAPSVTSTSRTTFDFCRQKRASRQNGKTTKTPSLPAARGLAPPSHRVAPPLTPTHQATNIQHQAASIQHPHNFVHYPPTARRI